MPPHRRTGAGAPSHGRTARLCRRCPLGGLPAFHGLDPERARPRIRPDGEPAARRSAARADRPRRGRDDRAAAARRARHRDRCRSAGALPRRVRPAMAAAAATLSTIGYEKARLADFIAALRAAGIAAVLDVRDRPISRRPGFSKRQLAAAIEAAGMRYVHLAALGTPPEGREAG